MNKTDSESVCTDSETAIQKLFAVIQKLRFRNYFAPLQKRDTVGRPWGDAEYYTGEYSNNTRDGVFDSFFIVASYFNYRYENYSHNGSGSRESRGRQHAGDLQTDKNAFYFAKKKKTASAGQRRHPKIHAGQGVSY